MKFAVSIYLCKMYFVKTKDQIKGNDMKNRIAKCQLIDGGSSRVVACKTKLDTLISASIWAKKNKSFNRSVKPIVLLNVQIILEIWLFSEITQFSFLNFSFGVPILRNTKENICIFNFCSDVRSVSI